MLELTSPYQLRTSDFDRYERIKPASVLDIFQDIAAVQAEDMGIGYETMLAKGVFWAVARTKLEIVQNPVMHSVANARTWPYDPNRLMFHRDYSLRDLDGNLLVKATSEWMVMNIETRTIASVLDCCDTENYEYAPDRAFDKKIRRTKPFAPEEATSGPFEVVPRESDVDPNGHVNNACYATYVLDVLDLGENEAVHTLQIDYRHEVRAGQKLEILVKRDGATILAQGMNEQGEVAFSCEIRLFE